MKRLDNRNEAQSKRKNMCESNITKGGDQSVKGLTSELNISG